MNKFHTTSKYALYKITSNELGVDFMVVGPFRNETMMNDFIALMKQGEKDEGNCPNVQFVGKSNQVPDYAIVSLPEQIQQTGDWN